VPAFWVRDRFGCVTVVVLTGATRGIGRAAAIELARRGADVVLVGRDAERVKSVAEEAESQNNTPVAVIAGNTVKGNIRTS
jgi:short-subunit dehydrogenase